MEKLFNLMGMENMNKKEEIFRQKEIDCTLFQALSHFLEPREFPVKTMNLDEMFSAVFNGDEEIIRDFASYLVGELTEFIFRPERINIITNAEEELN